MDEIVLFAKSFGISVKLRAENNSVWSETLLKLSYLPFAYTNASINFQYEYQQGHGGEWKDISLIIYWENKPCAIWPLSLTNKDSKALLSSHGQPVLPPLFTAACSNSLRKRITKNCLDLADSIAKSIGVKIWESAESFNESIGLSNWHSEAINRDATCNIHHELFIDLSIDISQIKNNFRKSYKSLITAGMRIWSVNVLKTVDELIWNEFRELHFKVSGRVTRSDKTWESHLQDIQTQQAFLVYLRNSEGEMVGGGFFNFTRDEGLYAVAAYDRTLFDKPLGHVVQYIAIQELKAKGIRWYKIGLRPYRLDIPTPTEKEISIGQFKQGFGTHLFPKFILRHPVVFEASNNTKDEQ
ncbi:MAG: FemAB family protein [Bacteroidia bacterium]|nr:FemAB family protein [Bacteroidia bacterium]